MTRSTRGVEPSDSGPQSKPLWSSTPPTFKTTPTPSGSALFRSHDTHWLWLLHDDAVPAPDALYQLLAHVTIDPSIDLTGPKLLLPRHRHGGQPISEVGVSISDTGRRELELDVDEIDQGQRDEPQERLGVSTCGMLVRTRRVAAARMASTQHCRSSGTASSSVGVLT